MDIEKIKNTIDDVGRKTNSAVNGFAAFHNFESWQVWLGLVILIILTLLMALIIC